MPLDRLKIDTQGSLRHVWGILLMLCKKQHGSELHALVQCIPIRAGYWFNWIKGLIQCIHYRNNIWVKNMEYWISPFK